MILFGIAVLALLTALIRGGRFGSLTQVPYKSGWLAFVAMGLQVVAVRVQGVEHIAPILFSLSYGVLIVLVVMNCRVAGIPIIGLGLALNTLVTVVNGGYMPVTPEAVAHAGMEHLTHNLELGTRVIGSKDILLARGDTHLWLLSDIFVLRGPLPTVFSVGDVILTIGIFVFFLRTMSPQPVQADLLASGSAEK